MKRVKGKNRGRKKCGDKEKESDKEKKSHDNKGSHDEQRHEATGRELQKQRKNLQYDRQDCLR